MSAGIASTARKSWAGLRKVARKLFRNRQPEQHPAETYADQLRADARKRDAGKSEPAEMKPGRTYCRPNQKTREKGDLMANAPIGQAVEAVSAIGAWEPESITDIDQFLADLGQLYEALASTQANLAQRFGSDLPIGAPVVEHLGELASGAAALTDHAGQGRAIFRSHHEQEFHRLENPRPHEEMWDITANQ